MQKKERKGLLPLVCITIAVLMSSCIPLSRLKYLNDISELNEPITNPREVKVIMPFDKITIKIYSIEDKTNQLFNSTTSMSQGSNDFLVDETGSIDFPLTGKIEVKGLTPDQAGIKIGKVLSDYVSIASVIVKFADGNITVLGEVQGQGNFTFSRDKLTIYEALALAGGISQYGDHKNVILIRQEGDKIMYHKLDLSNSRITGNNFYYVHANDIIVVEPLHSASWYRFNSTNLMTVTSTISTLLTIYLMITRL
jgi:polysaccharide biosynthesis/export protein